MHSSELPQELEFLRPFVGDRQSRYRDARWLQTPFDAPVWRIKTICNTIVDWRVPVGKDRVLLTSPAFKGPLEVFRSWLILQTHVDWTGGRILSPTSQHRRIHKTLDCIDYLLLNADRLCLAQYGLKGLSDNDYQTALMQIISHRLASTSIYGWPTRLGEFLRKQIGELDDIDVDNTIAKAPFLADDVPDAQDCLTTLNDAEIIRTRVWFWRQCRYRLQKNSEIGFRYVPDMSQIIAELYGCTVGGKTGWPLVRELCLVPGHRVCFEFPRAPVIGGSTGISAKRIRAYREVFVSLSNLQAIGLPVTGASRSRLKAVTRSVPVGSAGRFRTLPLEVVLPALRKAVEFALDNGEHLINSYLNLAITARNAKRTICVYAESAGIETCLDPETKKMGIKRWGIEACWAGSGVAKFAPRVLLGKEYFEQLRQNAGLYEMMVVLVGAIEFAIGVLSARRQGELLDLKCGECLDASRTRLVYTGRKSGAMGFRETIVRPIPQIAVELIEMLEKMQHRMVKAGLLHAPTFLFSQPPQRGPKALICSQQLYNDALDYFCDYVEIPLNDNGQRYYVREHQLRRFFALLFFWGAGFGGLDTLRYFFAHSNVEHIWHYVTEAVPGSVLRSVQAEWAAEAARTERNEATRFADLLEAHFRTRNFHIIDADVLTAHIEDLIEENKVTVEPQFLDSGQRYRVAILVKPREDKE